MWEFSRYGRGSQCGLSRVRKARVAKAEVREGVEDQNVKDLGTHSS